MVNRNRRPTGSRVVAATLVALLASVGVMVRSRAATTSPVLAWGSNADGQLGPATSASATSTAVEVAGLGDVVSVAAGAGHSLALRSDGTVWAWGRNAENELGDGQSVYTTDSGPTANPAPDRPQPGQVFQRIEEPKVPPGASGGPSDLLITIGPVTPLTNVKAVAAGWYHSLAVKQDGTVWAWGENYCGQLGNGKTFSVYGGDLSPPAAVMVPGLSGVVAVAAGRGHSLALDGNGALWAWGDNRWGQLGNGESRTPASTCVMPDGPAGHARIVPTKVDLAAPVIAMAAGSDHSLALTADGTVWSWGNNCAGQLGAVPGAATTSSQAVPVPVSGLPAGQVVALAAGGPAVGGHSLALTAAGRVLAWGLPDVLGAGADPGADSPCKADPLFASLPGSADVAEAVNQRARVEPVQVIDRTDPSGFLSDVVSVDAGMFHTLAVRGDGKLFAWGHNDVGQLGHAGIPGQTALAASKVLDGPVTAVSALSHSLALPGPAPARPAPTFVPGPGGLPTGPGDLPVDPGSVVPGDPTGLLPVRPGDLPVDPDNPPGPGDLPVDDGDVTDNPAGVLPGGGPVGGAGGGVFVTGSLADLAAMDITAAEDPHYSVVCTNWGCNAPSAQRFVRQAVAYVTPGDDVRRLLYVPWLPNSPRVLLALGYKRCKDVSVPTAPGCFDIAYNDGVHHPYTNDPQDYSDYRGPPDRDLRSVPFGDYDAVIVGSNTYLAELDVLVARQRELYSYLSAGGGLVAFSACGGSPEQPDKCARGAQDEANPPYQGAALGANREIQNFDYLPFLDFRREISERFRYQSGAIVTPEGRAMGLNEAYVVGTVAEGYFASPCGFDPLVRSADGFIVTMATHKPIPTPCVGAEVPDVRVKEGDGGIVPAIFSVSLGTARDTPVRLDYTTIAAGATAGDVCPDPQAGGADYLTTKGTLTFPAGDTGPLTVTVPVCGDRLSESDENFLLRLTSPDDVGLEVTATGTIVDDEPNPPGDDANKGSTPGGADRGENAQPPAQPSTPVQVPAPAPVAAPAPAAAAAPAVALAPALAPAPAPAPAASQAPAQQGSQSQAQQGSQAQAQQGSQAQAQAGSPAQATAPAPQVGMATDEQRQTQVETARIDGAADPDTLLASARRPNPVGPVALMGAAVGLALGLGGIRRRPVRQRASELGMSNPSSTPDHHRLRLRRARGQR